MTEKGEQITLPDTKKEEPKKLPDITEVCFKAVAQHFASEGEKLTIREKRLLIWAIPVIIKANNSVPRPIEQDKKGETD